MSDGQKRRDVNSISICSYKKPSFGILGAGLTGLTLGYLLAQRGASVELLEKEHECGGLMRSLKEQGFTFDYGGSHIIFSKDKEALDMMTCLLGENKIKNRRNTKVLYKDRYVKYPFENGLSDLPRDENFECLYSFIQNLIAKEKGEVSSPRNLRDWFYCTFGKGIAEKYLLPYNEKIWKHPTERMSLEWVERIPNPPVQDIIRSSLGIGTEGYTHQLVFYYPRTGGIQSLIEALQERIEDRILRGFEVRAIRKENGRWVVSDGLKERVYDRVVSTIPIPELVAVLDTPKEIKDAVSRLKYNSLITVMIGLGRPKVCDLTWLYIPARDVLTHRVSFPSNYSPYVAPEGKSSILAEITCNIGDEIWRMGNEAVIERVVDDLHRLSIINKEEVCFSAVRRLKYAYVISDLEYQENMRVIKDYMQEIGIDLLGRFSEFKYLNMDGCIRNVLNYLARNSNLYQESTYGCI
ncbi:MAG: hypothetical protein A4E49_01283 [Methanosaeta sp. PtaU1.Bin112]|nr:MAG: hypothetical protein A4E49_01283 [Methanosaeta sp. PtaU1.Bin112]